MIRSPTEPRSLLIRFVTRLLVASYLVETGILLICAPWTALWDRNLFASQIVWVTDLMSHEWLRGAVTGVGIVTVVAGLRDLASVFGAKRTPVADPPPGPATLR